MHHRRLPAPFGFLLLFTWLMPFGIAQNTDTQPLVILNVTVVNPSRSSVEAGRAVVVSGNRIASVSDAAQFQVPAHARVIDGAGQYMIPGLWDMHVHSVFGDWFPGGRDIILPLFIANGVTGVRDMGGELPVLLSWRKQIAESKIVGPRMVVSGPMLDGYLPGGKGLRFPSTIPVTTPAEARAAVDSLKARHADFVKTQSLISREAYFAAADESRKEGLPFVGHVPDKVRITEATDAGQKSIEHLTGFFEGCSSAEDRFLKGAGDMKLLLSSYDRATCDKLIGLLARTKTWQVPTLVWQRGGTFLDQLDWKHQPLDRYVPAYWRDVTWRRFNQQMMPDVLHDALELRQEYFKRNLQAVGTMHRAGVPLLAGTDTAPGIYVLPGFSLHDELANFVEAGLTAMEALQTATSNPATFLGRNDFGAIEPGQLADLVLLAANPIDNIHNTRKINGVVTNGKFLDRAALDQMLSNIAAHARAAK